MRSSLILLALSLPAQASAEFDLSIATGLQWFDVEETDTGGSRLVREHGLLPTVSVALETSSQQVRHGLHLHTGSGRIDYDGMTQSGTPHRTETRTLLVDAGYRLQLPLTQQYRWLNELSYHHWRRDIVPRNSVAGLLETYRWWSLATGMNLSQDIDDMHLDIELLVRRIISPEVEVDLADRGFGTPVLTLGDDYGLQLGATLSIPLQDGTLFFTSRLRRYGFGNSAGKNLTDGSNIITIMEPETTSWRLQFTAGWQITF